MSENVEKDRHTVAPQSNTVIVLNQQSEDRQPYPADPPDESNKRAKIPSIPSTTTTAADLKEACTAQHTQGAKQESSERTETTALSKKNLNEASAMLSSGHLPEIAKPFDDIVLATVESEPVLKVIPSEPIPLKLKPAGEQSRGSLRSRKSAGEESEGEDAEPTHEATAISDWRTDNAIKKKEVSWSDPEYLEVQLRESCSFDPYLGCGRARARAKPCGIAWRIPRNSLTEFPAPARTGIKFMISKGPSIQSNHHVTIPPSDDEDQMMPATQSHEEISPYCATLLREKLDTMFNKIKHFFKR